MIGCSDKTGTSASTPETATPTVAEATAPERSTDIGITVTGNVGDKPAVTVPTQDPPTDLVTEVLVDGEGAEVEAGQFLVADYLGQLWKRRDGTADVFDSTYDDGAVQGFLIGTGAVIPGWDKSLVGKRVGSRVLVVVPPALGYGEQDSTSNELAGRTLVFVVDILGSVDTDTAANGTPTGSLPSGMPEVSSEPGTPPSVTSVSGVEPGAEARSALLLAGAGEPLREDAVFLLQIVGTETATGKAVEQTWGKRPELVPGAEVLSVLPTLAGQKVGSRAVAVTPGNEESPSMVIVVDVIGQY
jgi:peptidylprolyl isomerase